MSDKTIRSLVDDVHMAVVNQGMDLSPSDVGHIISLFLEGMANHSMKSGAEEWLQQIADEAASVKDE